MTYHVQTTATQTLASFPSFSHHDSVSALWREKWRGPCSRGIYPFTEGDVSDFDPIFDELVRVSGDDPAILRRPEEYAAPFLPVARRLATQAAEAEAAGDVAGARDTFLRASAVFRIARFPINRSRLGHQAWAEGKAAYERGGRLLDPPSTAVDIPFRHADRDAGDHDSPIPAYMRVPTGQQPAEGWPVVLFICGLDAYRTDHTPRTQEHVERGHAVVSVEIPGTGDCPAAPNDPTSSERLWTSVLDWVATEPDLDPSRMVARGVSTGGYHAFRLAHTHAERLAGVVAQGGGSHHMFDQAWIRAQNQMEYPFALAEALAYKFGYRATDPAVALDRYAADAHRFSLLQAGLIGTPTCRLLAINGMEDSIFPVEDTLLVATAGRHKDLVLRGDRGHMGNPGAEEIVSAWIDELIAATRV